MISSHEYPKGYTESPSNRRVCKGGEGFSLADIHIFLGNNTKNFGRSWTDVIAVVMHHSHAVDGGTSRGGRMA